MKLIVAVDQNWGIGKNGGLLFRIPDDLKRFREMTTGHTVIMGRQTLYSLKNASPLPARENIVLSRDTSFQVPGAEVCSSLPALFGLLHAPRYKNKDAYVIGGAQVYSLLLPYCDTAYVTRIAAEAEADCFFPALDEDASWRLEAQSPSYVYAHISYAYFTYKNKKTAQLPVA